MTDYKTLVPITCVLCEWRGNKRALSTHLKLAHHATDNELPTLRIWILAHSGSRYEREDTV